MPAHPFEVVVFDLDGTVADSAADLVAALNHTLVELGCPRVNPGEVKHLAGAGARALLQKGLQAGGTAAEALLEEAVPIFTDYYAANICTGTRCYPGFEKAMESLAAGGVRLSLCTNKPESLARLLVDALGFGSRFASIVGGDTLGVRKPDPAPLREAISRAGGGRSAFVGDSLTDMLTARSAGIPFIAVDFGFSADPVETLGADAVIDRFVDLLGVLEGLS